MLGTLTTKEIDRLLTTQVTGRLGCVLNDQPYIVPINYVYKDAAIYAHSGPGNKIDAMRKNPLVCFQVDEVISVFNWKSAIIWGTFEELTDPAKKQQAMQGIIHRLMPLNTDPSHHPSHGIVSSETDLANKEIIIYRINITQKSGRFEQPSDF